MSSSGKILDIDRLHLPLANHPFLETSKAADIDRALFSNFNNGYIEIHKEKKFKIIYNCLKIGSVSINAAATSSSCSMYGESSMESFVFIFLTHGSLDIRSQDTSLTCVPGHLGTVFDFDQPSVFSMHPFYNNITLRFTRAAIEETLAKFTGKTPRSPLRFARKVDLSAPGPQRLVAILNQIITLFEQDTALSRSPLLVGQFEQLILTALLTCLEHNAQAQLLAPPPPAPPKVITLVEGFIEANADKPLCLGDLADLTGMSARSIQLAFKKHRGYSPSRFLRECRLSRARDMLRRAMPGTSLLSVSLACGFASQSLFCRLYRERFGEKPSETAAKA